jgi:hypothetical protein
MRSNRYRRKLVEAQMAERNLLLKVLGGANIKLASVATDVFGVSERLRPHALIDGIAGPREMAELAKGKPRHKIAQLSRPWKALGTCGRLNFFLRTTPLQRRGGPYIINSYGREIRAAITVTPSNAQKEMLAAS